MRKLILILLTLTLLLVGCQGRASAGSQSPQSSQNGTGAAFRTDGGTSSASGTITKEDAQKIALEHAGLTADQVTRLYTEPDRDDGIFHYDVEFRNDGFEYDYEIAADDGRILRADKEKD